MTNTHPFKFFILIVSVFGTFISCSKDSALPNIQDDTNEKGNAHTIKTYAFDSQNADLIFQDGEAQEVMTADDRRYAIANILHLKPVDAFTFEVSNFSPVAIENATVLAKIDGIDKQVKLFSITKISAFAQKVVRYSFLDESTEFRAIDGSSVELKMFKETGIAIDKISFDFTGESEYIQGLKKLADLNWELQFHDYDPENSLENNWEEDLVPLDVRRYTGMIINYGFMVVSDEFRAGLLAEKIVDNDGKTLLTQSEKENIYQRMLDTKFLQMGKVVNVSGLGGGIVFGVSEHILADYLENNQFSIVSHEFGHILGYNHDSGMTYSQEIDGDGVKYGISSLTKRINEAFLSANKYPITKENYFDIADFKK